VLLEEEEDHLVDHPDGDGWVLDGLEVEDLDGCLEDSLGLGTTWELSTEMAAFAWQENPQLPSLELGEHDLYLKPEKCQFKATTIEYLGVVVEGNQLQMDPAKVTGILSWPCPKTVRNVCAFIGFCLLQFTGTSVVHAYIWQYCSYVMRIHSM
jgi:hypothetical protein